jgi:hypothetical protein
VINRMNWRHFLFSKTEARVDSKRWLVGISSLAIMVVLVPIAVRAEGDGELDLAAANLYWEPVSGSIFSVYSDVDVFLHEPSFPEHGFSTTVSLLRNNQLVGSFDIQIEDYAYWKDCDLNCAGPCGIIIVNGVDSTGGCAFSTKFSNCICDHGSTTAFFPRVSLKSGDILKIIVDPSGTIEEWEEGNNVIQANF